MENSAIFCPRCGRANQPAARFCYACGQPLPVLSEVNRAPQAPAVLTLACPTCGGKLQVTPDVTRFACMFCGNEHMVKRGDGYATIEPVLREMQAVRQDLGRVQQAGQEVIRQAGSTARAASEAQNAAAFLASSGAFMAQISLLEKTLEDKKRDKAELAKGDGSMMTGLGFGLLMAAFILYFAIRGTSPTGALVIALTAGMFGGVSLLWGLIRVMVYMGKKGQVDALKAEIAAIEAQLRQLRSQIH